MKVWITNYALSKGILELNARRFKTSPGMIEVNKGYFAGTLFYGEGREWHSTRESAEAKAEIMRLKRISSLEKQIRKLKALNFKEGAAK